MGKAVLIGSVVVGMYVFSVHTPLRFDTSLGYGTMHSSNVRDLQTFLHARGVYDGPVTGNFLDETRAAVERLQAAEGIETTGYFGAKSRSVASAYTAATHVVEPSFGVLATGIVLILLILSAKRTRTSYTSSGSGSYSSSDSDSYRSFEREKSVIDSWGGHPVLTKGAASAIGRKDSFGNVWFTDSKGNTSRGRSDSRGRESYSDESGSTTEEKEGWFGGSYLSDNQGNTVQSRTDDVGNTYHTDNHGNVTRERTDDFGNKIFTREK